MAASINVKYLCLVDIILSDHLEIHKLHYNSSFGGYQSNQSVII